MTTTWYKVDGAQITPVKVLREFKTILVLAQQFPKVDKELKFAGWEQREQRVHKQGRHGRFFETWEEAHRVLLADITTKLTQARRHLAQVQDIYGNVKGMKPPKG